MTHGFSSAAEAPLYEMGLPTSSRGSFHGAVACRGANAESVGLGERGWLPAALEYGLAWRIEAERETEFA